MQRTALVLALAMPLFAGLFSIEFGNPDATSDPNAKGALTLVRATGCHDPAKASFVATAEGKVDGKRKSIPLEMAKLATPGLYAIKGDVPADGKWVIVVAANWDGNFAGSTILPVSSKGVERYSGKTVHNKLAPSDISEALK
jgi:hypothetical protein